MFRSIAGHKLVIMTGVECAGGESERDKTFTEAVALDTREVYNKQHRLLPLTNILRLFIDRCFLCLVRLFA